MDARNLRPASDFAIMYGCKALVYGPPGSGKCLSPGTPILMFDGSIKAVENVKENDLIMGPDSCPRKVSGLVTGFDDMFDIVPVKGMIYRVNRPHVLSLKLSGKPVTKNVTIDEYFSYPKSVKHNLKGWRTGVDFQSKFITINPYLLGLWLGDGSSEELAFHTIDKEIVDFLQTCVGWYGIRVQKYQINNKCPRYRLRATKKDSWKGGHKNQLSECFKSYNLFNNKHVPFDFKSNSKEVRLQVLAGLLDSDGHLSTGCFDFISKLEILADDVCYLSRSLGLAAYKTKTNKQCVNNGVWGEYYRVSISGNTNIIPTKLKRKQAKPRQQIKDALVTGISIIPAGYGKYHGFKVDADGLFLLGDFTVTHNTPLINTAPRPLMLACEPGLLSMRGSKVPTYPGFTADAIDDFFEWFFKSTETKNYDTIAVDSLSQMCEIYLNDIEKGTSKSGKKVHGLAAYGEMNKIVLAHLGGLYFTQNKHTYLIAKQELHDDGSFKTKRPYFPGRELPIKIPHMYDLVTQLDTQNIPGYGQQKAFRCIGSIDVVARNRTGTLAEFEPPDFSAIVKKVMA